MRSRALIVGLFAGLTACLSLPAAASDPGGVSAITVTADASQAPAPVALYALRAHDTVDAAVLTRQAAAWVPVGAPLPSDLAALCAHNTARPVGVAATGLALASGNSRPNNDGRTSGATSYALAMSSTADALTGPEVPAARTHAGSLSSFGAIVAA